MTKVDITDRIQTSTGLSRKASLDMLELVLSLMKNTLETGEDVKISGFGKFVVKHKKERRGRNPATGDTITLEARRVLSFKPSTVLRKTVNK